MPKAVRFDEYGGIDVLRVDEVERPVPAAGEVLVEVRAAAINPGEAAIRGGAFHDRWPATFPSGEGSDLAGVVRELGPGVDRFAVGDEVLGWTDSRASHAELVAAPAAQLVPRPAAVPWEVAGSLYVAGSAAWASVRAVAAGPGDTVAVSAAAGGVGSIAVQLARLAGARVIGLASEHHHRWLSAHDVIPVTYGDGVEERIRAASGGTLDAFVDAFGGGYVDLALALGVAVERINTIIDFAAAARLGVKAEGNAATDGVAVVAELADLVATGRLEVPIARAYPLAQVQDAYRDLEQRHTGGKIVLLP
jgi:NADPH:quinone reductase-like Zn-dependent oxidoreductase